MMEDWQALRDQVARSARRSGTGLAVNIIDGVTFFANAYAWVADGEVLDPPFKGPRTWKDSSDEQLAFLSRGRWRPERPDALTALAEAICDD